MVAHLHVPSTQAPMSTSLSPILELSSTRRLHHGSPLARPLGSSSHINQPDTHPRLPFARRLRLGNCCRPPMQLKLPRQATPGRPLARSYPLVKLSTSPTCASATPYGSLLQPTADHQRTSHQQLLGHQIAPKLTHARRPRDASCFLL